VWSERSYFTCTVTSFTLFGNAKAVTDIFFITDRIRSEVTSYLFPCLFPCWTRNRSFSPLKSPYLNWPGIWFWPFPSSPSHLLYRAPPFSCVRSPTIASSTPNPHPPKFYFRNLSNWITHICKGKKTRKGSCLCLCALGGSCIVFDPIHCIFCVCFAHYTYCVAFVFGVTNANAYLCAHCLECFSELVFLFSLLTFIFWGERDIVVWSKRLKNQEKGNWKWKNSDMEQGDHGLVNRLISHLRKYFRYLLPVERGMRFMLCIFRVMSYSACSEPRILWCSLPDSHFAMYSFIYEIRKRFSVCFL